MNSRMLILMFTALMLNAVLALPVRLDSLEDTTATDEELLQLLAPQELELEPNSMEHLRRRRDTDCDHDSTQQDSHNREERAVSEGSSEEKKPHTEQGKEDSASDSSSEEQKDTKVVAALPTEKPTEKPARRRRAASEEQEQQSADQLDPVDQLDAINIEDYAQGCEVLEVDSSEAINNETYVE